MRDVNDKVEKVCAVPLNPSSPGIDKSIIQERVPIVIMYKNVHRRWAFAGLRGELGVVLF
jgi:hypothetical protein